MKKKGILFIVSAPSGSGKTTLCKKAVDSLPGMSRSISMTTRLPRAGEQDGMEYVFIDKQEFFKRRKKDEFLEWATVFDEYYGTPKRYINHLIQKGQDVVLNIDVVGTMKVKKTKMRVVCIFIMPPSIEILKQRLVGRSSDSKRDISKRLKVARKELSFLPKYDYVIINNKLEMALEQLRSIVIAERCRTK